MLGRHIVVVWTLNKQLFDSSWCSEPVYLSFVTWIAIGSSVTQVVIKLLCTQQNCYAEWNFIVNLSFPRPTRRELNILRSAWVQSSFDWSWGPSSPKSCSKLNFRDCFGNGQKNGACMQNIHMLDCHKEPDMHSIWGRFWWAKLSPTHWKLASTVSPKSPLWDWAVLWSTHHGPCGMSRTVYFYFYYFAFFIRVNTIKKS